MRAAYLIAAVAALWAPAASAAELLNLRLDAYLTGTRTIFACDGSDIDGCTTTESLAFNWSYNLLLDPALFSDGFETFQVGGAGSPSGIFTGRINYLGGTSFTGINLDYQNFSNAPRLCGSVCYGSFEIASASTFSVAGVPEPSTWALLVLGFGTIAGAMRRRRWDPAPGGVQRC